MMNEKNFLNVDEVAAILGVSKPCAYKQIKLINDEMNKKGYHTVAGKVNRKYFCEKFYIEIDLGGAA